MNNYYQFLDQLLEYKIIAPISKYVLEIIEEQIEENKEELMTLFCIYFSLLADGNIGMSLNKKLLSEKWSNKIDSLKVLLEGDQEFDEERFESFKCNSLKIINDKLELISEANLPLLVGKNKIFSIEDEWIYLMKYNNSRKAIMKSIDRIFNTNFKSKVDFSYKDCVNDNFFLSAGQEEAVKLGLAKNIIVTGGPGTGKTTSILFLLLGLLSQNKDYKIYLVRQVAKPLVE